MTYLSDVLDDKALFDEMLAKGCVSQRFHPEYPELAILNYTEKAAFERVWNVVTKNTRGLIYNTETHEVLARPFQKIHNWDEPEAPPIAWDQIVCHWDNKYDGSLGIVYKKPDGNLAVATRGSFESEQAKHATHWLQTHWKQYLSADGWIKEGFTPLYEIIYPENRIVLDYEGKDYLQPLGVIEIASGAFLATGYTDKRTFGDLVTDLSRPNAEGWVVWVSEFKAVKIKQPDYVELHKIVTGLNRKSVWRALKAGEPAFKALLEQLPDELWKWAQGVAVELRAEYGGVIREIDQAYLTVLDMEYQQRVAWDAPLERGRFARLVQANVSPAYRGFMFSLLDGKDIQDKVWQMIEPKGGDK